jgi:hypothetical protein
MSKRSFSDESEHEEKEKKEKKEKINPPKKSQGISRNHIPLRTILLNPPN